MGVSQTANIKKIPLKAGNGYFGVKEAYQVYKLGNTHRPDGSYDVEFNILLGVDNNLQPCRICFSSGNQLKLIRETTEATVAKILKGRAGLYSRLDCVYLMCRIKGVATVFPNINGQGVAIRSLNWQSNPIKFYIPINIVDNQLITIDAATKVNQESLYNMSIQVLNTFISQGRGVPIGDTTLLERSSYVLNRM